MPPSPEKRAEVEEKRRNALRLRAAGLTYPQIAQRQGYSSAAAAAVDVARALRSRAENLRKEATNALVMELERLDTYVQAAEWAMGRARSSGDAELALKALDRLTRLTDRRVDLLGLSRGLAAPQPEHVADELRDRRERRRRAVGG